ncbi:MAG: hydroxyacid dehydrogenase [Propionibacteriaceae bacterium]|jgi:phosphoglycerate dehydrogenase-like enzyme|nr:hydroxyacid dehydrogenase [Propionibacteriaceae bacterium]
MKILVAMPARWREEFFTDADWGRLQSLGEVEVMAEPLDWGIEGAVRADAEVLVTGWGTPPLAAHALDGMPSLRAIVHCGGTVRCLVPAEVYERGIQVSSQARLNALPVAQYCLAHILLAAKKVPRAAREYHSTRALDTFGDGLSFEDGVGVPGARVGLIGYGKVAHALIEYLRPFGMDVLLHTPYVSESQAGELGVRLARIEEAMSADVVCLHLGDTPDNHGFINADLLALVPDGATFINTARGIVVDQDALVKELVTGRFDAVLDVTWPEPPEPDSPLWTLPNVTLTPHWAGSLGRELTALGHGGIDDVELYLTGRPMRGAIDPALAPYIA